MISKPKEPPKTISPADAAVRLVRKSWPLMLASLVLGTAFALLYSKTLPRVYEATALLQFDPNPPRPLSKQNDPFQAWSFFLDNHEVFETQFRVITSESVLAAAARDLSLLTDPRFGGQPGAPAPVENVTAALRARLKVEPIKQTRLFNINYQDNDPKQARRICEAIARTFIGQNMDKTSAATMDAVGWLSTQADTTKHELDSDENALQDFKRTNELPSSSIDEISKMVRMEMQEYDEALTHTRTKKQELLARDQELSKLAAEDPGVVPSSELLASGFLGVVRSSYQQAVKERAELLAGGKGEKHPLVLATDVRVDSAKRAFTGEIDNIQQAVRHDLAVIQREESGEQELYDEAQKKGIELNLKELEYRRLDRVRVENEKLYEMLLEQLKEADLARLMNVNTVLLIDPPLEPKVPIKPNVLANTGIGTLVGLALGILLTLAREQLDPSLNLPEDVEKQLGLTFLGLLPDSTQSSRQRGSYGRRRRRQPTTPDGPVELIVHTAPLSEIAETARSIRTNLMFMNPDRPFRKLLISSAAPGEGKTTVACSIALAFAQGGQRVCLIDCDLRRPRLHRIFDRAGEAGVTSVLLGEATVDEAAKPTIVDNLWSIPAGPLPPNPADILHSDRFRKLLDDLAERFDRVIIDSPPLVAVTDSAILSTIVDGTVFVVRAGKTSRHIVGRGLRSLRDVDANVLGAVLNAVNLRKHDYAYYHRYYYYRRTEPEELADLAASASPPPPPN